MTNAHTVDQPESAGWPNIVLPDGDEVIVGRSAECQAVLVSASISRQHAKLSRHGEQLKVEDMGSRFGTIVNGHPIRLKVLVIGDIVRFGSSPPYRFDGTRLALDQSAQGMSLHLSGIEVTRGKRRLLGDVNVEIEGGSFVGVLGPSGSGKSLLLGCLSDTLTPSSGKLLFDQTHELPRHRDYYRSKLGFVPQEDIIYEKLTVLENLRFAAKLRFPDIPKKGLDEKIAVALDAVDMERHKDKRAGVLSGGQKKRVSIAVELLTQPRLLLLDEPTSGLDPGTQFRLMDNLRNLSRRGITVVCVTHSTDTINFFDSLLVLGFKDKVATVVYHDSPEGLLPHFCVKTLPDLFDKLQSGNEQGKLAKEKTRNHEQAEVPSSTEVRVKKRKAAPAMAMKKPEAQGRYLLSQTMSVVLRTAICIFRDRGGLVVTVFLPIGLAFLISFTQARQSSTTFASFFLVIAALWMGMTLTVREIVNERKLYVRDRLAGLRPAAFVCGKIVIFAVVGIIQALTLHWLTWIAVSFMANHDIANAAAFKGFLPPSSMAILPCVSVGGALLGLIVSTLVASEQTAVSFLPLLLLPQVLISRVATGSGGASWGANSNPFIPVINVAEFWNYTREGSNTIVHCWERFVFAISQLLVSRPGTSSLDLMNGGLKGASWEFVMLMLLLLAHLLVWIVIFRWREKRWSIR